MSGHLVVERDEVLSVDGQDGAVSRAVTASCPSSRSFITVTEVR
jgi:hypothetical protein